MDFTFTATEERAQVNSIPSGTELTFGRLCAILWRTSRYSAVKGRVTGIENRSPPWNLRLHSLFLLTSYPVFCHCLSQYHTACFPNGATMRLCIVVLFPSFCYYDDLVLLQYLLSSVYIQKEHMHVNYLLVSVLLTILSLKNCTFLERNFKNCQF